MDLRSAVQTLYHNSDERARRAADRWLLEFQSSAAAWEAATQALSGGGGESDEVQFIAAQTLATKVRRDFDEVPSESVPNLRETLVSTLLRFTAAGMSPVCPQLCIAVAAMAGHMDAASWGGNVVSWLKDRLQREAPAIAVPCMMQMLSVLPEEAETRRHLRPERRRQFIAELAACVPAALELLSSCLDSETNNVRNNSLALGAYAAWLRLGSSGEVNSSGVVDCVTLARHPLTASALNALQSEENFDAAVDVAAELIRRTAPEELYGEPSAEQTPLVQLIVPHVMGMRQLFTRARAEDSDIDDTVVKGMARLFAEIGEAYVGLLSTGAPHVVEPVEVLLEVAAFEDFEIAEMSFRFWERLARVLLPGGGGRRDGDGRSTASMIPEDERIRRQMQFTPVFEKLASIVMRRVQYPENFGNMSRDAKSDFYFMRGSVADCLRDSASVIGGESCLRILSAPLQEVAGSVAGGAPFDWVKVEGAMYCIYSVCRLVQSADSAMLPQIFASVAGIPREPKLVLMVANNIGAYADWFAKAADKGDGGAELLPPVLTLLGEALAVPETARPSSYALKMICQSCSHHLSASFIDPLLQICQQAVGIGLTQQQPSGAVAGLDPECVILIIEGVSAVLTEVDLPKLDLAVRSISQPLLESLKGIVGRLPHIAEHEWRGICMIADRLAALLKGAENEDATAATFRDFWPFVNAALGGPNVNYEAAERLCRLCNTVLMSSGHHAAELLQHLVPVVQQRFAEQRHCCYIYSTSQMIKFFGGNPQYTEPLAALVRSLLVETMRGIQTPEIFDMHPDMVDDAFILAGRCLRYCPKILIMTELLGPLLDWGILGMHVQHKDACASIQDYFQKLIKAARPESEISAQVLAVLPSRGPTMVRKLLAAIAGALPAARLPSVSDTLILLLHVGGQTAFGWVQGALQGLPVVVAQPEDLRSLLEVSKFESERPFGGEERYFDLLDEFSFLCQRNKRSVESARNSLMQGLI